MTNTTTQMDHEKALETAKRWAKFGDCFEARLSRAYLALHSRLEAAERENTTLKESVRLSHATMQGEVIENDLLEAINRADSFNLTLLPHIVAYALEHVPHSAFGDAAAVTLWLKGVNNGTN